jgi:hypothetical protein
MSKKGKEPAGLRRYRLAKKRGKVGKKNKHTKRKHKVGDKKKHAKKLKHHVRGTTQSAVAKKPRKIKNKKISGKGHMKWGLVHAHKRRVAAPIGKKKHNKKRKHGVRGIISGLVDGKSGSFMAAHKKIVG